MANQVDIPLDEDHRIRSDDRAFYVAKKRIIKGTVRWEAVSWHVKLEHLIASYRTLCIRECGATTLAELLEAINRIDERLDQAFHLTGEKTVARAAERAQRTLTA